MWPFNSVSFPAISVPVTAYGVHLPITINDTLVIFFPSKNIMNGQVTQHLPRTNSMQQESECFFKSLQIHDDI